MGFNPLFNVFPIGFVMLCAVFTRYATKQWQSLNPSRLQVRAARALYWIGLFIAGMMVAHLGAVAVNAIKLALQGKLWPFFHLYSLTLVGLAVGIPGAVVMRSARPVLLGNARARRISAISLAVALVLSAPFYRVIGAPFIVVGSIAGFVILRLAFPAVSSKTSDIQPAPTESQTEHARI